MDGRRGSDSPRLTQFVHTSEPELDMRRDLGAPTGTLTRLARMLRGLISARRITVAPMRSIGRELEESWPMGEN
jgi:hypothetical protein